MLCEPEPTEVDVTFRLTAQRWPGTRVAPEQASAVIANHVDHHGAGPRDTVEIVTGPSPASTALKVRGALVVPAETKPKSRLRGLNMTTAPAPVPVSLNCWGDPGALSKIVIVAVRGPPDCGVNRIDSWHDSPGASVLKEDGH